MQIVLIFTLIVVFIMYLLKSYKYRQLEFLYNRTNAVNDAIMKVAEEISDFQDINDLYRQILEDTIDLIKGAECGSILIYNKEKDLLEYKAAKYYDFESLKNVFFKKEELFLYKTTGLKYADIIVDPHKFDRNNLSKENLKKLEDSNSLVCKVCASAPLYVNGEFYGILNVDNLHDENAFDKKDIRLIQYICRQLEMTIKNALLVNQLNESLRIDKLTQIYNRRYFEEIIDIMLNEAKMSGEKFLLAMIDMDNFKDINDNHGHKVGDEALKIFSKKLLECLGTKDIAARFAGDEFVIVFHGIDEKEAERRIEGIRNYFLKNSGININIEFSAGFCMYKDGMDIDELLSCADMHMYENKRKRKKLLCDCNYV